jgi:hypothetical protein
MEWAYGPQRRAVSRSQRHWRSVAPLMALWVSRWAGSPCPVISVKRTSIHTKEARAKAMAPTDPSSREERAREK